MTTVDLINLLQSEVNNTGNKEIFVGNGFNVSDIVSVYSYAGKTILKAGNYVWR